MPTRRCRSALRLAVLGALALVLRECWSAGPAYAVKGAWEGDAGSLRGIAKGDLDSLLKGLEPDVDLPAISYAREGLQLSVEDGKLNANYVSKLGDDQTLQVHVNDEQAWRASLSTEDAYLRVRGHGPSLDGLFWEASRASSADGVGDVKVDFNSDGQYNLTISRDELATVVGADLSAKVRATNHGFTGLLAARRELPQGAILEYSVENPVGVYDMASSTHTGSLGVPVAGGQASLKVEGDSSSQGYYGSFARELGGGQASVKVSRESDALGYNISFARSLGKEMPTLLVGVDESGAYGGVTAQQSIGEGASAEYVAVARLGRGANESQQMAHQLKISNKLGYAQLSHSLGSAPRLRLGYEFNA